MSRALIVASSLGVIAALTIASCTDDDPVTFPKGGEGGSGGDGSGGAVNGSGGNGATDAGADAPTDAPPDVPFTCEQCDGAEPICVDEAACAAACPDARAACHTSPSADAASVCCEAGEQCCGATENGYAGGDLCRPAGEACPIACPGGDVTCDAGERCLLDPGTGVYGCTPSCADTSVCGDTLCCPLGALCVAGACPMADLGINTDQVLDSYDLVDYDFQEGSCSFFEGCIAALGPRTLLRFDLNTPNLGTGDLHLGDPTGNPLFHYSECHDHFHFDGYARYRLLDLAQQEVATGHKQAFCLLDLEQFDPNASPDPKYDCGFQGIQAGWADVYDKKLPCQWVDVTGVPPGEYLLEISLNADKTLAESDYDNNLALIPVTID
jgi:hypothetical protein